MKILFISSGSRVPSSRFRILPYLRHFRRDGHVCVLAESIPQKYDYFPWMGFRPSQLLKRSIRWWHCFRARLGHFDIVYIDREVFDDNTTWAEERLRQSCRRLVLDIDDAIFLRHPDKFDRLLSLSDLVICGNRFLQEEVVSRRSELQTTLIPTCVDMDDYAARDSETTNALPVVGWMGTAGNLKYINVVAEALRTVAREIEFEFQVVVPDISELKNVDLTGVRVRHVPWEPSRETEQLQQFDIGLMPLFPDQKWDIYKCGLKLIQYLAVGVPGIASPVGVNSEILEDNQNGFAAQTTAEWTSALTTLLRNSDLRQTMGARGRKTVVNKYSIQANYPILKNALAGLLSKDSE